ncbi:zinc finger matrin-type protein 4 isoform X1 [Tachysurus ichikawai]
MANSNFHFFMANSSAGSAAKPTPVPDLIWASVLLALLHGPDIDNHCTPNPHARSRKHANKVRLYYMLHPVDGGCPAKKLRTHNGSEEGDVDKNKCCTLCNMSFTSAVVAQSHYQGKIHAKRLKLVLGEQPSIIGKEVAPSPVKMPSESWPQLNGDSDRYCQLCHAWFNNPGMARQHYDGKKHKKNAARADLLEQLGKTLDMGEMKGLKRSYTCDVCSVTLNSVAQYHAHLQGSKHQNK